MKKCLLVFVCMSSIHANGAERRFYLHTKVNYDSTSKRSSLPLNRDKSSPSLHSTSLINRSEKMFLVSWRSKCSQNRTDSWCFSAKLVQLEANAALMIHCPLTSMDKNNKKIQHECYKRIQVSVFERGRHEGDFELLEKKAPFALSDKPQT